MIEASLKKDKNVWNAFEFVSSGKAKFFLFRLGYLLYYLNISFLVNKQDKFFPKEVSFVK